MSEIISITIEQIDNMKHAIGYNKKKVDNKGIYRAYRNYFTTSTPDGLWEQLVDKGYAIKASGISHMIYDVSPKGLELLEDLLDIKIVGA